MYRIKKSRIKQNGSFLLSVGGTIFNLTGEDIELPDRKGRTIKYKGATQEILERVANSSSKDLLEIVEEEITDFPEEEEPKRRRGRKKKSEE
jgi:hypothetical protein